MKINALKKAINTCKILT